LPQQGVDECRLAVVDVGDDRDVSQVVAARQRWSGGRHAIHSSGGTLRGMSRDKPEPMTPGQKQRLESELAELEGPRRKEVVEAIATARGFGDLSENFEYHAAKNDQGLLEHRIRVIRDRLDRAVVVDQESSASGEVGIGSTVEVEDDNGKRMIVEISSVGGVSPDSPLGGALLGTSPGDIVEVDAPRGAWRARVIAVSHPGGRRFESG
jgi:transcription elongation factor GreA